jgi:hypothetical protein
MATEGASEEGSSFDELRKAMPQIAAALKDLPESVQGKAFDALVASITGESVAESPAETTKTSTKTKASKRKRPTKHKNDDEGASRRRVSVPVTLVKELDLAPKGKKSFKDFVAEKRPTTQHDRSAVAMYWLAEIAGISPISVAHVYTCYRNVSGWTVPNNMTNSLAVTAHRKGYFDTADGADIKLMPQGINRVEQELPQATKAKT